MISSRVHGFFGMLNRPLRVFAEQDHVVFTVEEAWLHQAELPHDFVSEILPLKHGIAAS